MASQHVQPARTTLLAEPISGLAVQVGLTPGRLGLLFFAAALGLSAWTYLAEPQSFEKGYVSYLGNISWPISLLAIFPLIVGLTVAYYLALPKAVASLSELSETEAARGLHRDLCIELNRMGASAVLLFGPLVLSILYNLVVLYSVLNQGFVGWMSNGAFFSFLSRDGAGLTGVGLAGLGVQTLLVYWVVSLLARSAVFVRGLSKFFDRATEHIEFRPNHPDRCYGLKSVGDAALILNGILFLLGVYLSLRTFDKLIAQEQSIFDDVTGLILLAGYLGIAPLLFHRSIAPVHKYMSSARRTFLAPAVKVSEYAMDRVAKADPTEDGLAAMRDLKSAEDTLVLLKKKLPVWPFGFHYRSGYSVIMPVLSLLVSLGLIFLKNAVLVLRGLFLVNQSF